MERQLISARHEVFIDGLIAGKTLVKAGKDAGFTTPDRDAVPIMVNPQVRQYVRKRLRGALECEGAPSAYKFLVSVMRDEQADKKLRVEVAKFLYASAGYVPPKAQDADNEQDKSPSEMTSEELKQFIEQGEAELAARATPINADTPQAIDNLL